jgi:hypothetical protein
MLILAPVAPVQTAFRDAPPQRHAHPAADIECTRLPLRLPIFHGGPCFDQFNLQSYIL